MTLYELGAQYQQRAREISERIHTLRRLLPTLSGQEEIAFKRRLLSLYNDAAACRETAKKLMEYYERSDGNGSDDLQS